VTVIEGEFKLAQVTLTEGGFLFPPFTGKKIAVPADFKVISQLAPGPDFTGASQVS